MSTNLPPFAINGSPFFNKSRHPAFTVLLSKVEHYFVCLATQTHIFLLCLTVRLSETSLTSAQRHLDFLIETTYRNVLKDGRHHVWLRQPAGQRKVL